MADLTPVTVIAGYLGAGKTTIVNSLLSGDHGRRLAVLVNDFGSVNVDVDLIERHDGETISLTNGCICCSIADSLGESLDKVLAADPRPDQIVIEASGVADPSSVATYGQGWPGCRLDAVVVAVDAETIRARSRDQFVGELVTRQLRRGDVVLLTKLDLLDPVTEQAVRDWLREVTDAPVVAAAHGSVDHKLILDLAIASSPDVPVTVTDGERFEAGVVEFVEPATLVELQSRVAALGPTVVRAKGIVEADGALHVVQRVGHRVTITPAPAGASATPLVTIAVRA